MLSLTAANQTYCGAPFLPFFFFFYSSYREIFIELILHASMFTCGSIAVKTGPNVLVE